MVSADPIRKDSLKVSPKTKLMTSSFVPLKSRSLIILELRVSFDKKIISPRLSNSEWKERRSVKRCQRVVIVASPKVGEFLSAQRNQLLLIMSCWKTLHSLESLLLIRFRSIFHLKSRFCKDYDEPVTSDTLTHIRLPFKFCENSHLRTAYGGIRLQMLLRTLFGFRIFNLSRTLDNER